MTCIETFGNEVLSHPVQHAFKKGISVVGVSGKPGAVDLALPGNEVIEQRNANAATNVPHEVADAGDLVKLLTRYAHIVQGADRNEDQWDADHLDDAVSDHCVEADAKIDVRYVKESKRSDGKAECDDRAGI